MAHPLRPIFQYTNKEHGLLVHGQPVLVAVSGGMDSMCLLDLLHHMGFACTSAHVDHGLREEGPAEEHLVSEYCEKNGIPLVKCALPPGSLQEIHGVSVQMAARDARRKWLLEQAEKLGITTIATAHHREDALETLLLNLMRGTGIAGWAGIRHRSGKFVRPLLDAPRSAIQEHARFFQVPFAEDSSNKDPKYMRNRVRHELLPVMETIHSGARTDLYRSLGLLRGLVDHWTAAFSELGISEDAIPFAALETAVPADLILHELLRNKGFHPNTLHKLRIAVSARSTGARFESPTHDAVVDRTHILVEEKQQGAYPHFVIHQDLRSTPECPITLRWTSDPGSASESTVRIAAGDLRFPLTLRPWQAGDRMLVSDQHGPKLISDLLIDRKVPRSEKERTYVLVSNERIIWLVGHRVAADRVVTSLEKEHLVGECL